MKTLRRLALLALVTTATTLSFAQQPNYQGLWWGGPSESGWNLHLSHQDDVIFALWATHDEAGMPTWFSMSAVQFAPDSFSGTFYRSTVAKSLLATLYDPSSLTMTEIGTATLAFSREGEGTFTYRVGDAERTKRIVRFEAGAAKFVCTWHPEKFSPTRTNSTDIWYSSRTPGSAIGALHIPGTPIPGPYFFADTLLYYTWFTYAADGSPIWFFGVGFDVYGDYDSLPTTYTGTPYLSSTYVPPSMLYAAPSVEFETDWKFGLAIGTGQLTRYVFRGNGTMCEPGTP